MGNDMRELQGKGAFIVLRYEASEAPHGLRNALLIGRNDLAEVFRVYAGRQCR
jgi:hypothetical protein